LGVPGGGFSGRPVAGVVVDGVVELSGVADVWASCADGPADPSHLVRRQLRGRRFGWRLRVPLAAAGLRVPLGYVPIRQFRLTVVAAFERGVWDLHRPQIARHDRNRTTVDRQRSGHLVIGGARRHLHLPMTRGRRNFLEADDDRLAGEPDRQAVAIQPDKLPGQVVARPCGQFSRG